MPLGLATTPGMVDRIGQEWLTSMGDGFILLSMVKTTKAQRKALHLVWVRHHESGISYRAFRQSVQPGPGCIMVRWCGMWLGIEPDGYTHS